MKLVPVKSSNIKEVGYDDKTHELFIRFNDDKLYKYPGVPEVFFKELVEAKSVGGYFHAKIKGRFLYSKVNEA